MRTRNGVREWVDSLAGARLVTWLSGLRFDKTGKNSEVADPPVLRARLDGVRWVNAGGHKTVSDIGRTERFGEPYHVETGDELSGYDVVAELGLSADASPDQIRTRLIEVAKGAAPTAEEASDPHLFASLDAIARADAAEAEATRLRTSADSDKARAQEMAAAAIAAVKTQSRDDVKQLVLDRKDADAMAEAEKAEREKAQALATKLADEKAAVEHELAVARGKAAADAAELTAELEQVRRDLADARAVLRSKETP